MIACARPGARRCLLLADPTTISPTEKIVLVRTRNAFLLPPGQALLALQFSRIIRQANNPARRAFQSRPELISWLAEVLRPPERLRLETFLSEEQSAAR